HQGDHVGSAVGSARPGLGAGGAHARGRGAKGSASAGALSGDGAVGGRGGASVTEDGLAGQGGNFGGDWTTPAGDRCGGAAAARNPDDHAEQHRRRGGFRSSAGGELTHGRTESAGPAAAFSARSPDRRSVGPVEGITGK